MSADEAETATLGAQSPGEWPAADAEVDPLVEVLAQRDEYLDALRRLQAEFENYRKRVLSQQAEQAARGVAVLVERLLPVLDTLDLAAQHLGDAESADGKALVAVGNQLHDLLAKDGLERIDPLGEVFDPTAHEAVGHVPADTADEDEDPEAPVPKPVVAQVMRPGYRWKGAVLRPAMVTVRG
ncbi:MAG TPA: nucleotide exchange factor GrpE [Acidimicrobiales bacterium]|nr:nucleotide exchange factor GrpE [Acidimicrobiales bacterium]